MSAFHTTYATKPYPVSSAASAATMAGSPRYPQQHRATSFAMPTDSYEQHALAIPAAYRRGSSSVALRAMGGTTSSLNASTGGRHTPAWYRFQRTAVKGHKKRHHEAQVQRWKREATKTVSHKDRAHMLKVLVVEAYRYQNKKKASVNGTSHAGPKKRASARTTGAARHTSPRSMQPSPINTPLYAVEEVHSEEEEVEFEVEEEELEVAAPTSGRPRTPTPRPQPGGVAVFPSSLPLPVQQQQQYELQVRLLREQRAAAQAAALPPPRSRRDFQELLEDVDTLARMTQAQQSKKNNKAEKKHKGRAAEEEEELSENEAQEFWHHVVGELSRVHLWR